MTSFVLDTVTTRAASVIESHRDIVASNDAVDSSAHGLGALLLAEALRKAVTAGEAAAARLVVVDAIDEAAARFYARHGFITVPDHPPRLYRRIKDVRASQ